MSPEVGVKVRRVDILGQGATPVHVRANLGLFSRMQEGAHLPMGRLGRGRGVQ